MLNILKKRGDGWGLRLSQSNPESIHEQSSGLILKGMQISLISEVSQHIRGGIQYYPFFAMACWSMGGNDEGDMLVQEGQ